MAEEELPPEAHHTLFMSGLPLDMQKREATHIFRPFEGYKARPLPDALFQLFCDCGPPLSKMIRAGVGLHSRPGSLAYKLL